MKKWTMVLAVIAVVGWCLPIEAADFNGDGRDDIGIFRSSSGLWSVRGITRVYFGGAGDLPVPGDYNNNGRDDLAIFRPATGLWAVRDVTRIYYGGGTDLPFGATGGRWTPRGNDLYFTGGSVGIGTDSFDPVDILTVANGRGYFVNSNYHGIEISNSAWSGLYIHDTPYNGIDISNCAQNFIRAGSGAAAFTVQSTGNVLVTGDLSVGGTLTKASGTFKIDHPLDPENWYLSHSFVESPDMMNIYNGNAVLDGAGEATVTLSDWFDALNRDFRYQLTCLGGFAPVYIAEEISGTSFKIAGGTPGLKVSWQVTGIRRDPWAEANRVVVEEEKPESERGYYLHPEVYGRPESKSLTNARMRMKGLPEE